MNKLNFIKTLICTLVIFSLASCGMKETTSTTGGTGAIDNGYDVLFDLTGNNLSKVTPTSATYTYAPSNSFTLTATKTNLSSYAYASNFSHYTVTPANVLNITGTTTNSITFALTNMDPGSVKITATATNNLGQTNGEHTYTINLQKASYFAPPITYITMNQTSDAGAVVTYAVQTGSDKRSTYQNTTVLTNISGSATAGIGSDGTVTVTNGTATGTSIFEVNLTSPNYLDYAVRIISVVGLPGLPVNADAETSRLFTIISNRNIPTGLGSESDPLVKDTLIPLEATPGSSIKVLYVTESGLGDLSGRSWDNALSSTNLRTAIANIADASASKPYLVLVGAGTYKTTYATIDRTLSFTMKNHTAIIGGFNVTVNANNVTVNRDGTTTFSGDIRGGGNGDNIYHVFYHNNIPLNNAVLYGVTITDGNASGDDPSKNNPFNKGGGMYNNGSSPRLVKIVFSDNRASQGGGMYNASSSPVLTGVVFSSNNFSQNGGGMYNDDSSPVLTGVVFNNNFAVNGGGMYNNVSSPVFVGAVFSGNSATFGGGMYNDNGNRAGPLIVNTIFVGNTAVHRGSDIGMKLSSASAASAPTNSIRIAGSVLGIGLQNPTNGMDIGTVGSSINLITYNSLTNGEINFGADATTGGLTYPTIQSNSSAVDIGLYVRRDGNNYYFSEDGTTWYTSFATTGGFGTAGNPPAGAEDLTARDIAGNARVGRPDAGVYEYKP